MLYDSACRTHILVMHYRDGWLITTLTSRDVNSLPVFLFFKQSRACLSYQRAMSLGLAFFHPSADRKHAIRLQERKNGEKEKWKGHYCKHR